METTLKSETILPNDIINVECGSYNIWFSTRLNDRRSIIRLCWNTLMCYMRMSCVIKRKMEIL